jgi:hypothetical protein
MPNLTLITLTAPSLPANYCPASYQKLANDIIGGTQATFNSTIGNSFFNFGPTYPAINNRIYPWLDENGQWWIYDQGVWLRKNPVTAAYERRIYVGTTTDLLSYDGGDGTAIATTTTGPMWEVDTEFEARFPVGVGAFVASGAVAVMGKATSTSIAGEDQHKLTVPELAAHTHNVAIKVFGHGGEDNGQRVMADGGSSSPTLTNNTTVFPGSTLDPDVDAIAVSVGGDIAHNNLPPFYGVYFIKRTIRVYYTK